MSITAAIMRYCYALAITLAAPLLVLRLLWRSIKLPAYRKRIAERFGIFTYAAVSPSILVHAVSVGESIAAIPVIKQLQQKYPRHNIVVTCTTPTGSVCINKEFGNRVLHVYLPFDIPGAVQRFLNTINPEILVIMETELWPNLLYYCNKRAIRIILANARLSARSYRRYKLISTSIQAMLQQISIIAAQSTADADRFISLGATAEKVIITGNIKFDINIDINTADLRALKIILGHNRPVWIAASTHAGEEELVLQAFRKILVSIPEALLILVPRHPNRFIEVATIITDMKFSCVKRSSGKPCAASTQVFLGDSMGELNLLYAASAVAFVGGSLVNIGGHNLLEPAAVGVPIVTGDILRNFIAVRDLLLAADALTIINNINDLASKVIYLLQNNPARATIAARALQVVADNKGALEQLIALI